MNVKSALLALVAIALTATSASAEKKHTLHIVTTGDVHGSFFDEPYVGGKTRTSLMSVKHYVDSLRNAVGAENVMLLDAGDILQGDNAAYYYNYVATGEPHLYPRMAAYMGYDAVTLGNHDIETGHPVYERFAAELTALGIPVLGGNIIDRNTFAPYFPVYTTMMKAGLKVAVLGFDNANIKAWLDESLWTGLEFLSLENYVQNCVNLVRRKEKPQVVVVVMHSGTGEGDGQVLENQGLDVYRTLRGVDVLVCAHDHRPHVELDGDICLVNGGARAGYVGHAVVEASTFCGSLKSKTTFAETVRLDKNAVDEGMKAYFKPEFNKVKEFTLKPVGQLAMPMETRESFVGMCDYINLIHTVQLEVPEAQLSFAAPLTYNGHIKSGQLVYNDLFTIYQFENQLFVVKMKGEEIRKYLEYSYDNWIQTPGDHVLKIVKEPDPRTGAERWSFVGRTYNFDSCAGLCYYVDVTKPAGERVGIISLADGSAFDPDGWYNVAMTSYRASGGGDIIIEGAGIPKSETDSRIIARYPEIRELIHQYIGSHGVIDSALVGDRTKIGSWRFVPEEVATPAIKADMELVF